MRRIKAKIDEAWDDPRPSLPLDEGFERLEALHTQTMHARPHDHAQSHAAPLGGKRSAPELYHYTAERSGYPERAITYIRRIRAYCETLASFPKRGRRRDDLRRGLWVIGFERLVVIAYAILDTGDVEIGRIFYRGRDYEAIMRDDEEA